MGQKGMFYDECSCEKKQEGDKDDHVDQRGPRETMQGKQGVYSPSRMHLLYEKASKQIERQNKTAKQGQINMYIRTKIEGKRVIHEEQKKTDTNNQNTQKENEIQKLNHRKPQSNAKEIKLTKKHGRRGRQTDKNLQKINNIQKRSIW